MFKDVSYTVCQLLIALHLVSRGVVTSRLLFNLRCLRFRPTYVIIVQGLKPHVPIVYCTVYPDNISILLCGFAYIYKRKNILIDNMLMFLMQLLIGL